MRRCVFGLRARITWRRLRLAIVAVPRDSRWRDHLLRCALYVGPDGILHLDVPIEVHDAEIEVMVTQSSHTNTKAKTQKS